MLLTLRFAPHYHASFVRNRCKFCAIPSEFCVKSCAFCKFHAKSFSIFISITGKFWTTKNYGLNFCFASVTIWINVFVNFDVSLHGGNPNVVV